MCAENHYLPVTVLCDQARQCDRVQFPIICLLFTLRKRKILERLIHIAAMVSCYCVNLGYGWTIIEIGCRCCFVGVSSIWLVLMFSCGYSITGGWYVEFKNHSDCLSCKFELNFSRRNEGATAFRNQFFYILGDLLIKRTSSFILWEITMLNYYFSPSVLTRKDTPISIWKSF